MNPSPERKPGNLVVLESTGYAPTNKDVAVRLREWADAIEQAEATYGTVAIVMEVNGDVRRAVIGGPNDRLRVLGLLFYAATRSVGECAGWEDDAFDYDDSG